MSPLASDSPRNSRLRVGAISRLRVAAISPGLAAVLALCLAGCGSHYTRQDFISRANGICLSTTRAVRSLTPPQFTGTAAQQQHSLGEYLTHVAPLVQSQARRLAALPQPPGSKRQQRLLARWLAAEQSSAVGFKKFAAAAISGNADAVADAGAAVAAVPVVQLASQYGARDCAAPGASYTHAP
jgi:hypothetical protein